MTHDPLCPWSGLGDYWADVCEDCHLIARVREDERSATLRDAVTAIEADTEFDELGDQNHAVEIIEALVSGSFPNREESAYNKEKK